MPKAKMKLQPAGWQTTATTIQCDFVDDFVTIMVNKDWSAKCVWYNRYKQKSLDDKKQKLDRKSRLKVEKCNGPECSYVINYRDKLIKEELEKK